MAEIFKITVDDKSKVVISYKGQVLPTNKVTFTASACEIPYVDLQMPIVDLDAFKIKQE